MIVVLAAKDPSLFLRVDSETSFGMSVFGIGYENSGSFGVSGAEDTAGEPVTPAFTDGFPI